MVSQILTRDDLRRTVPSVFATRPIEGVSGRYAFLPTSEVIDIMQDQGFFPVKASQSTSRDPDRRPFTRHCIRFRSAEHLVPALHEELPEIVLVNSHDKSSAYGLSAGIHRLICQNGLTVASATLGNFSIRHSGHRDTARQIIETTAEIVSRMPALMDTVRAWKQIILPRSRQIKLAEEAWHLKPNPAIRPAWLLTARRPEDMTREDGSRNLWTTFNSIEESLIRGGVQGVNSRGRRIRTRPVKSISADLHIHRRLWALAESYSLN